MDNALSALEESERKQTIQKCLNLLPLEKRMKIKSLTLLYKFNSSELMPNNWFNEFTFKSTRNGIKVNVPFTRLYHSDNHVFYKSTLLFNSLPMFIRNSIESKKFLSLIHEHL